MAKLAATESNTPTPKDKISSKNAFPTFTPSTARMTRAQAKAAGDAAPLTALTFGEPIRAAKKTKIPPGVGLEPIPSPGNLKVARKTRGTAKKAADEVDKVVQDFDELDLGKKKKAGKASRKGKEKEVAVEEEEKKLEEVKTTHVTRSKPTTGKAKARSTAGKTSPTIPVTDSSDEEVANFELNPVIPPSLQSRITKSTTPSDIDNEALLASISPFLSRKKLWEMDEEDVANLRAAAEGLEASSESEMVIKGMLDVVEKFQAFRDGLDQYIEEMEGLGLQLEWDDGMKEEN
ncbi:hypothetical protein IQ06DRAFT_353452 [Phaeosphaeriaceae sp. SRC1lsM3a]|nr:hypothetical protein IQ06DRAFT_353452 [Stagonospora sp. SRC1lsM3a]